MLFINNVYALSVGSVAPAFNLVDRNAQPVSFSVLKGKFVVLEWFDHSCQYVQKHYRSGNIQTIQSAYKDNDYVKWITIVSSKKGEAGHIENYAEAKKIITKLKIKSDYFILDPKGIIKKQYNVNTVPQIFILGPKSLIKYMGAVDSTASALPSDVVKNRNYITATLSKLLLKQRPSPAKTRPYGCSL